MANTITDSDSVRASRGGHTYHERWAARRALQLVFPNDGLYAIAVEGISSTETAGPGASGEEVADLVLYYGKGDNLNSCDRLETVQFKYMVQPEAVTGSFLKKTIEKFAETILGYEKETAAAEVDAKVSFMFVTNTEFNDNLWAAIASLIDGSTPKEPGAKTQAANLRKWCAAKGLSDARRLFSRIEFKAGEKGLAAQDNALRRTLTDWSAGSDPEARQRLFGLQDLIIKKAGPSGQGKNLIHREDILDALDCYPEDLFPADTRFIDVSDVIERKELEDARDLLAKDLPLVVHADGGVGKTVFVQSLAAKLSDEYEIVVFDCFGGGSYRSDSHSRHLPRIGLVQIVNELASRTLCDPLLPGSDDRRRIVRSALGRLKQAALAVKHQSTKRGLLVIVDAADNAQLEADHRHEDAFPKYLLAALNEDPVDGVNLLLTARTHRRAGFIANARVNELKLGPFTEQEAREFLKDRKPDATSIEITTALARSGRNARVLDYLVNTWSANVAGDVSVTEITVPDIIEQRCTKIIGDLHIAGWTDSEIADFFVAISLLPPPMPLDELAGALGWSVSQVNTAASDLAPMLEVAPPHGAMFRDEPTETYIRDTYSDRPEAQKRIADRLISSQSTSMYAAEALPHFLVVIKDSALAFALADSTRFPSSVQSDFGRRRLTLARLRAAFRLAVAEEDFDKILGLSMRLAQAATANMRGDEFIRRAPELAVILGDTDSYRRVFADRSGWRGARSARLTVAHHFAGDDDEAQIQCESTIRWINWHIEQPRKERGRERSGPGVDDYAAVLFHNALIGDFVNLDRNLARWNFRFSLDASAKLLDVLALYDIANGTKVSEALASFVASKACTSDALALKVLSRASDLLPKRARAIARRLKTSKFSGSDEDERLSLDAEQGISSEITKAGLSALFVGARGSAAEIVRKAQVARPSAYDYGERWGYSRAWGPIRAACLRAWCTGKSVSYHDLLPHDVRVSKKAKAIADKKGLMTFLAELREPVRVNADQKPGKSRDKEKFNYQEREQIADGIELALTLVRPIEAAALSGTGFDAAQVDDFLKLWGKHLKGIEWKHESAVDLLARTAGLGCLHIVLDRAGSISVDQAKKIVELISASRFFPSQKTDVLAHLTRREGLEELSGEFAQKIADQIRQDDNVGQRGEAYADLAAALVPLSIDEARDYYRQGLAQLDQMGGESYDQIYSLLHFASTQRGGFIKPALAQRLMNLTQTIMSSEPSKFGWTLFARAAATSIGYPAIAKIVRWHDQDVVNFSYGLPQLACFMAEDGYLDPRRAAFVLTICEDHGWHDWRSGTAVSVLLQLSTPGDQRAIFHSVLRKLRAEYPFGGWPSLWESYLETGRKYPDVITTDEIEALERLRHDAQHKKDEHNSRNDSPGFLTRDPTRPSEEEVTKRIEQWVSECDPSSPTSIDQILKAIGATEHMPYDARRRFLDGLRSTCPYGARLPFMFAVCEASELSLGQAQDILVECLAAWRSSTAHLDSNLKAVTERLLTNKGAELFEGQFANASRGIQEAATFCGDRQFVLQLVLRKIAADEVDLDGDEWLQLATSLCELASPEAGRSALELLLAGPGSRIADEIGEGPFRPELATSASESDFIADVVWHLLGDPDAYVRWGVARELSTLVDLGLTEDLGRLLERFDQMEVSALRSVRNLSFQNSREWLSMGIARAARHHRAVLAHLQPKLIEIASRSDIHVLHKTHLARAVKALEDTATSAGLTSLLHSIDNPPRGFVESDAYPAAATAKSGFSFDYDFSKTEIANAAHLFGLPQAAIEDAMGKEITRLWPSATSMDFFGGRERYQWDLSDRYEYFREHVQRHALLSAVTSLSQTFPIIVRSYEVDEESRWLEWRHRYDITFDDGLWLSDKKDDLPQQAKASFLGPKVDRTDTLQDQETVLEKLAIITGSEEGLVPLYGRWTSPDGVDVSITSALAARKGAIGRCKDFARAPAHDFWLPEFWDGGYYDRRARTKSPFAPFVWSPETHNLGIDAGDEIAAKSAARRPRLGIDLTTQLALSDDRGSGDWRTVDGDVALRSQVWGSWKPDPDQRKVRMHDDGEILWASPQWLQGTLADLKCRLVSTVTLWKYKSSRSYDESSGAKSVYVLLRDGDGRVRVWPATKAAKVSY